MFHLMAVMSQHTGGANCNTCSGSRLQLFTSLKLDQVRLERRRHLLDKYYFDTEKVPALSTHAPVILSPI